MAIITADRAADSFPAFKAIGAGVLCAAYGFYDFAAEPAAADVLKMCKVPKGAVILGGFIRLGDMDTNANETLDFDVGTSASTALLGNFGVQTGDALAGYLPEGGILLPLHLSLIHISEPTRPY